MAGFLKSPRALSPFPRKQQPGPCFTGAGLFCGQDAANHRFWGRFYFSGAALGRFFFGAGSWSYIAATTRVSSSRSSISSTSSISLAPG